MPTAIEESGGGNRLILCFDGTGNAFTGTPGDTNIVKLYKMFDRENNDQMHYYQPGIGTYPAEGPVNVSFVRSFFRKIEAILDAGFATSFDSHVIAGYKFIMRNYMPGDKIYIFGFSRGAFTARFVARMISHVGLLSRGNEELIPFAYKVYQDYETNRDPDPDHTTRQQLFMNTFKSHFCRTKFREVKVGDKVIRYDDAGDEISNNESGIKVHFLGLFDCVSSVGNLDIPFFQQTPPLPAVVGTAKHIRHAVAIDERRVKFKAALFAQEGPPNLKQKETLKEVWFPGNHGDIGGGWDIKEQRGKQVKIEDEYFQLSDIALKWMMDELDAVEKNSASPLAWDAKEKISFLNRFEANKPMIRKARMHDTMVFGGGSDSPGKIVMWNIMEYIPWFIKRWEYKQVPVDPSRWNYIKSFFVKVDTKWAWDHTGFPPNFGGRRDIPANALFHNSVRERMVLDVKNMKIENDERYTPKQYLPNNQITVTAKRMATLDQLIPSVKKNNMTNGETATAKAKATTKATTKGKAKAKETEPLIQHPLHFDRQEGLSVGSAKVTNDKPVLVDTVNFDTGAQDWDYIYTVAERQ